MIRELGTEPRTLLFQDSPIPTVLPTVLQLLCTSVCHKQSQQVKYSSASEDVSRWQWGNVSQESAKSLKILLNHTYSGEMDPCCIGCGGILQGLSSVSLHTGVLGSRCRKECCSCLCWSPKRHPAGGVPGCRRAWECQSLVGSCIFQLSVGTKPSSKWFLYNECSVVL